MTVSLLSNIKKGDLVIMLDLKNLTNLGFNISDIVYDSKYHRFNRDGHDNGWYIASDFGNFQVVNIGDWKTGEHHVVKSRENLTETEKKHVKEVQKKAIEQNEIEKKERHEKAGSLAEKIWEHGQPLFRSKYLTRKKITELHNAKTIIGLTGREVAVPMRDQYGQLWGIQTISPYGEKKFMYGQKILGLHHLIGEVKSGSTLYICEGFATGCSIYQATQLPVLITFNTANLPHVAKWAKEKYNQTDIVIAGDEDLFSSNKINAGRKCATETALSINANVVFPKFKNLETKPTDFNDLYCLEGPEAVAGQLNNRMTPMDSELIPEPLKGWVLDGTKSIQVPLEYIAFPAIGAFANIVGKRVRGKPIRKGSYFPPTSIWTMGLGEKGTAKTSALNYGSKWLGFINDNINEAVKMIRQKNRVHSIMTSSKIKDAELRLKKAKDHDEIKELLKDLDKHKKDLSKLDPPEEYFVVQEVTSASLIDIAKHSSRGIVFQNDELASLFSTLNKDYNEDLRSLLLQGYNAEGTYTKKLKGEKEATILKDLSISIIGMVQPSVFAKFFSESKNQISDGFLDRFQLIFYPDRLKPKRRVPHTCSERDAFRAQQVFCNADLGTPSNATKHTKGFHYFPFSPEAEEEYLETDVLYQNLTHNEADQHMVGFYSKAMRLLVSLAVSFFVMRKMDKPNSEKEIPIGDFELALKWVQFVEKHARKAYGLIG